MRTQDMKTHCYGTNLRVQDAMLRLLDRLRLGIGKKCYVLDHFLPHIYHHLQIIIFTEKQPSPAGLQVLLDSAN